MTRGNRLRKDALRRYLLYKMKLIELIHFHLLWLALNRQKFAPENTLGHDGSDFSNSVRTAALAWFCTMVDQSNGGLNVFKLWHTLFPKHRKRIDRVWNQVQSEWEVLRNFRDRCAFHADTPQNYFRAKQRMLESEEKVRVVKALNTFMKLAVFLLKRDPEELPDFVPEVEEFLLDFELKFDAHFKRDSFKRLLILPRGNYRKAF
jgi:hypothetical protein